MTRTSLVATLVAVGTVASTITHADAQLYPTQPVRILVGYSPGGSTDIVARLLGERLSERLRQPFIIENRAGANSNIATEAVVKAPADGHTLLLATSSNLINASLYDRLTFNFAHDIAPVASIVNLPNVIVVHPSFPAKTVAEFIHYAKANPGKVSMASPGAGSTPHLAGELFKMMAGINMIHVPYRGGAPALTDLLGGQVQVYFPPMASAIEYIRAGKLRALAVTSATRSAALPTIPVVADFLPGYEASTWFGLCAPKNAPAEVIDRLNREVNAALADPKIKAQLADLGGDVVGGPPADFGKLIVNETDKWARVVKFSGVRAD
jgi:tripartite-type tricarboxylate transporter receptor subunit TctC